MIATDVNPAQIALVCLKLAVIRQVAPRQAARWMIADARGALDEPAVRESLSPEVVGYWQKHRATLSRGLCFCGVIERRLRWLNRVARPLILRTSAVNALLRMDSPEQQADWFAKHWKGWRWSAAWNGLRLFVNLGYHQSFRHELPEDTIRRLQQTFESVLTSHPVLRNPWLQATLTGSFGEHPPSFLAESGMERIRARFGDLEVRVGDLESLLNEQEPNSCHLVSLSNIADTLTLAQLSRLLCAVGRPLTSNGLVVLRSMIRDSSAMAQLDSPPLRLDDALTAELRFQDRSPLCPVVGVWRAAAG